MIVAVYLLDYLSSRSQKRMHTDSFGCAKMIQADVNIVILGVPYIDNSDGTKLGKNSLFWHMWENSSFCHQGMVEQLSMC